MTRLLVGGLPDVLATATNVWEALSLICVVVSVSAFD
jgi:hypothetical protein